MKRGGARAPRPAASVRARGAGALVALGIGLFLSGCASTPSYVYRPVPGRTASLGADGRAIAPARAPRAVRAAIDAGNRIAGLPYRRGGGHGSGGGIDRAYDCSGAASHVLRSAGLLRGSTTSTGFRRYGVRGRGEWISVYARRGHVFLSVAGLRFDTGWNGGERGPRWTTRGRPARGYALRHPAGL